MCRELEPLWPILRDKRKGDGYQEGSQTAALRGVGDFPLAVQLFGSEPEVMADAAVKLGRSQFASLLTSTWLPYRKNVKTARAAP